MLGRCTQVCAGESLKGCCKVESNGGQSEDRVSMTKEKLVENIKELLKTDNDLDFLLILEEEELERLVACIRDRVDRIIQRETI